MIVLLRWDLMSVNDSEQHPSNLAFAKLELSLAFSCERANWSFERLVEADVERRFGQIAEPGFSLAKLLR